MTSIFNLYSPEEIMGNEKLETFLLMELDNSRRVRDMVQTILAIPRNSFISVERCAELYEVEEELVREMLELSEGLYEHPNVLITRRECINLSRLLHESKVAKELRIQYCLG
ncbi:hypothetical protein [Terribacillus sp. DMT04]|uniref:hypothetical protein n=1 Tax=Terribacillus sp. DMT04 TaxID=2850441 RepID=UPI001C2BDF62|nr:hypothetical protein [Terribacillus sp. DMT04]QXE01739.1 hypothetical protein KS242_00165 [Terribacillus sp. DMT04]